MPTAPDARASTGRVPTQRFHVGAIDRRRARRPKQTRQANFRSKEAEMARSPPDSCTCPAPLQWKVA